LPVCWAGSKNQACWCKTKENIENKRGRAETVRPKSREETPKEGSEASDQSHRLRPIYLDVRRTNYKGVFALQKSGRGMAVLCRPGTGGMTRWVIGSGGTKEGAAL